VLVVVVATYFVFVEDKATILYFFELQVITLKPSEKQFLEVDFLSSK